MKLHQFGMIRWDDPRELTLRMVGEVLKRELCCELRVAIESMVEIWTNLDRQIRRIVQQLEEQASKDSCEKVYRSASGIGPLSARMLSNELGDMSQFRNERALYSFIGLTPSEYSSGEKIKRGHISRQGPSRLRGILVEAAWRAIREDADLRKVFQRLFPRIGKKRAIIAVARRLIGKIRAAFRKGELYRNQPDDSRLAA